MLKAEIDGVSVEMSDTIQGHLLWDAMRDFMAAYERLTQFAHDLHEDAGGPINDREVFTGEPHHIYDRKTHALGMRGFATRALGALREMENALKRAEKLHKGEVYDELIDRSKLGPKVENNGNRHTVYIRQRMLSERRTSFERITHIVEEDTGMQILAGNNVFTSTSLGREIQQAMVSINTEECGKHLIAENGEPIMAVSLNDADLYDNEGNGDMTQRGEGTNVD